MKHQYLFHQSETKEEAFELISSVVHTKVQSQLESSAIYLFKKFQISKRNFLWRILEKLVEEKYVSFLLIMSGILCETGNVHYPIKSKLKVLKHFLIAFFWKLSHKKLLFLLSINIVFLKRSRHNQLGLISVYSSKTNRLAFSKRMYCFRQKQRFLRAQSQLFSQK